MLERVEKFIIENNLISKGDKIIVALSGGPDSVALLHILEKIREKYNLKLGACHINHLLRGEDAMRDEDFAKNLCKALNIDFYSHREDIKAYSKKYGIGEEESGRRVRYGFFEKVLKENAYNKIALGHNLDDNIETFLFRLMRGTSLDGLNSIPLKRDNIIRPIMNEKKKDILSFLNENNFDYAIDHSNFEIIYTRNKIRLDLIPYIEKEFNPLFVDKISEMIEEIKETNMFFQKKLEGYFEGEKIFLEKILTLEKFLRKRLINMLLRKYEVEVSREKLENIDDLLMSQGPKEIDLGRGYIFNKGYKYIKVEKKTQKTSAKGKIALEINDKMMYNGYIIESKLLDKIPSKKQGFYFDYDKLDKNIYIRTRKNGDKFIPFGMNNKKKLKNFFIDSKVEKDKRELIPLILTGEEILLVGDLRGSNLFRVDKETKKVLLLKVKEVESSDGQ